jgi:hypothetical protein
VGVRRHLFRMLSALSLLVFVAVVVLWVRGYFVADELEYGYFDHQPYTRVERLGHGCVLHLGHVSGRYRLAKLMKRTVEWPEQRHFGPGPNGERWVLAHPPSGWITGHPDDWSSSFKRGRVLTFEYGTHYSPTAPTLRWFVTFPDFVPAVATAVLPALWLVRALRVRRRSRHGLCPTCGYDVRATPERCPECGHVTAVNGE